MNLEDPREYRALGYLIDGTPFFVRTLREWDRRAEVASLARDNGITVFEAEMLPSNTKMIEVFDHSGYQLKRSREQDSVRVVFPIHDDRIPF